jgi:hypothetical protein
MSWKADGPFVGVFVFRVLSPANRLLVVSAVSSDLIVFAFDKSGDTSSSTFRFFGGLPLRAGGLGGSSSSSLGCRKFSKSFLASVSIDRA